MLDSLDPVKITQTLAFAQIAVLILTLPFSMGERARTVLKAGGAVSGVATFLAVAMFLSTILTGSADPRSVAVWALVAVGVFLLQMAAFSFRGLRMRVEDARLQTPAVRTRAGDELRAILRTEGVELDERLESARHEREQFLYTLEERHAAQIANLAEEYQAEARTILEQLLDQLAAEQLQPMVERRLAEHEATLRDELGVLEQVASGETLNSVRDQIAQLTEQIDIAAERVEKIRAENPDGEIEDRVNARVDEIVASLDGRRGEIDQAFAGRIDQARAEMERRIDELGRLVDGKVDLAGNPLVMRMEEAQGRLETRMGSYMEALDRRFAETEQLLSDRTQQQERALEDRVAAMEQAIEERLERHSASVDSVLDQHDTHLHEAIERQLDAVNQHVGGERDRLIDDIGAQVAMLREQVRSELGVAEAEARETVAATHQAWDEFTRDLEKRFAETRQQALDEARAIAEEERRQLLEAMEEITATSRSHIQEQLEQVGREAAWQQAQVERTVADNLDLLQRTAQEALDNADSIFADLERMGADRVDAIRVRAEESLISSREYVEQLEGSLATHLDAMQSTVTSLAGELDTRLAAITDTAQQAGDQLESYARELLDSVTGELTRVSEDRIQHLTNSLNTDLQQRMQAAVDSQQQRYEEHLLQLSRQVADQTRSDLAGFVADARSAVSGELDSVMAQAREQAQSLQHQGHQEILQELARQQQELAATANEAAINLRSMLDDAVRDNRRQLDESLASMGGHLREELVRFQDEGRRRVEEAIQRLRESEQDLLREEDRKLSAARGELVRRHQDTIQRELASALGGFGQGLGHASTTTGNGGAAGAFAQGLSRPATPLGNQDGPPLT